MAQIAEVGKVSKNQRAKIPKVRKVPMCRKGHTIENVLYIPGPKGRAVFKWWCDCDNS